MSYFISKTIFGSFLNLILQIDYFFLIMLCICVSANFKIKI